jgi:hypothetical protein
MEDARIASHQIDNLLFVPYVSPRRTEYDRDTADGYYLLDAWQLKKAFQWRLAFVARISAPVCGFRYRVSRYFFGFRRAVVLFVPQLCAPAERGHLLMLSRYLCQNKGHPFGPIDTDAPSRSRAQTISGFCDAL